MHGLTGLIESAAALVLAAYVLLMLCARAGMPGIVGYILAGALIGPAGIGLVAESDGLATIGEVGVILLLFALGLEFSFGKLASLRRHVFGIGAAQVTLTTVAIALPAAFLLELAPVPAILLGGAVAMSSTAMCLKVLAGANALGSPAGRMAISILLFQDLAAVGLLLMHDSATGTADGHGAATMIGGAAALVAVLFVARGPLQALARWTARQRDSELAQLLALAIALGSSIAATKVGLSPALAAFAAGMIIGEGDARHVVEREIRPFRDLFVGIFFIGIGVQLPLGLIPEAWPAVLIWLVILMIGKALIVGLLGTLFGEEAAVIRRTGMILGHGGEFGLMLISVSMSSGLISGMVAGPLLLAIGFSMPVGSILVRRAARSDAGVD
ncbi:cation:proton antiporter [Pannonibacter indicus]|uniref:Kef-type K+ transport system, membrane component KefB n=1 Tax=Pannonibacter indicus TaxID=466044 RepID=A0A0K6IDK5_9HYPH|nr:cation:proton antiporter [Pannonibacter indicus]CUB01118.1 Kef-type K+ transport system, membrane component KefB [Pannonibacter indicus]